MEHIYYVAVAAMAKAVAVVVAVDVAVAMVLSVVMGCHGNSETEIRSHRIHVCVCRYRVQRDGRIFAHVHA